VTSFLDDLDRIASDNYVPSDDDVLRARLKTVGVSEYRFTRETTNMVGSDWRIYDVGGSRTQRAAWAPYFQDVDAIIFLAPISCFDQVLVEDSSVNRLEDTVILWKQVCNNSLLKKCNLILFMNKTDLMAKKLQAGVRLSRYIPSFGTRDNDFTTASACMYPSVGRP
jgi:guanine nucleotide-binding protein subunit alpha